MTRTAIYSLQDNALTEQPAMERPHEILFYSESVYTNEPSFDHDGYDKAVQEYNDHIKSLRTIPCHESARSLWKDGDRLEEGKDYEVREMAEERKVDYETEEDWKIAQYEDRHELTQRPKMILVAFPLPVKSEQGEENMWTGLFKYYSERIENGVCQSQVIRDISQKYIITKR